MRLNAQVNSEKQRADGVVDFIPMTDISFNKTSGSAIGVTLPYDVPPLP